MSEMVPTTLDVATNSVAVMKKIAACSSEKRSVKKNSFPFFLRKLSIFLPNIT